MTASAYVLIEVIAGQASGVLKQLNSISSVKLAEVITGPYDLIVKVEAANTDGLGKEITQKVQPVHGVLKTLTCMVVNL